MKGRLAVRCANETVYRREERVAAFISANVGSDAHEKYLEQRNEQLLFCEKTNLNYAKLLSRYYTEGNQKLCEIVRF